jgi:hypothetical protein
MFEIRILCTMIDYVFIFGVNVERLGMAAVFHNDFGLD